MKVLPKNDDVRRVLKHPVAKGFRKQGPAEWPNDSFTARRIRDGDVTVVETEGAAHASRQRRHNKESKES